MGKVYGKTFFTIVLDGMKCGWVEEQGFHVFLGGQLYMVLSLPFCLPP